MEQTPAGPAGTREEVGAKKVSKGTRLGKVIFCLKQRSAKGPLVLVM